MAADLWRHGSVDDEMPGRPIEVTWCATGAMSGSRAPPRGVRRRSARRNGAGQEARPA